MGDDGFTKVSKAEFDLYPGEKQTRNVGEMAYFVRSDEERPLTGRARRLADLIITVMEEEGLVDEMAKGGMAQLTVTHDLASAIVAVQDELSPQYARKSVASLADAVAKAAKEAENWAIGNDRSCETTRQRRGDAPSWMKVCR